MKENIKIHKYKDGNVKINVSFDGKTFMNATEAYKASGKSKTAFDNWKTRTLIPYAKKLLNAGIAGPQFVDLADLVVIKRGGKNPKAAGTWLHPKLAVVFARWISTDFEIWCDQKIGELLRTGKTTATIKERSGWLDMFPGFYKAMSGNGYWGSQFKKIVIKMEDEASSIRTHKSFIAECSNRADTEDRLPNYYRMIEYYEFLLEKGLIERRTWEDVTRYIFKNIGETQTKRLNKTTKRLTKVEKLAIAAEENFLNLNTKYKQLTAARENPPISTKNLAFATQDDIDSVEARLHNLESTTLLFKGFLEVRGGVGSKGGTLPAYESRTSIFNPFNVVAWINEDGVYLKAERLLANFSMKIKPVNDDLMHGLTSKSLGNHTYCLFNPNTLAMVIYKNILSA